MNGAVRPMPGFRLVAAIIAIAWIALVVALAGGAVQTDMAWGDPLFVWSFVAAICAAIGAIATYALQRWGAILYLIAAGSLFVQSWLFEFGDEYDFGWGYLALFVFFLALVATNWRAMGGRNA